MAVPLINGTAYDYASIELRILGVTVTGVTSITYAEEQDKVNNFGAGDRPVSRGRAAINASASMDIDMNEIEAIRDAAPQGSLLKIPAFEAQVTFLNDQKIVTHTLKNCEFLNDGVDATQGDTNIVRSFDIVCSHIAYR